MENKVDIGRIITAENGKARPDAEGEVLFAASFFEWFTEEAARLYGDVIPHSNATSRTHVIKEPVGVWVDHPVELPYCNGSAGPCCRMHCDSQVRWSYPLLFQCLGCAV